MVPRCSWNIGSGQSRRSSNSTSKAPWARARSSTHGVTLSEARLGRVLPTMIFSSVISLVLFGLPVQKGARVAPYVGQYAWLGGGGTDVGQDTVAAAGFARLAHPSAVQDQAQAEPAPIGRGDHGSQLVFHLHRVGEGSEPQAQREPANVRIHGQAGQIERHAANHIGGFATDAGN